MMRAFTIDVFYILQKSTNIKSVNFIPESPITALWAFRTPGVVLLILGVQACTNLHFSLTIIFCPPQNSSIILNMPCQIPKLFH